MTLDSAAGSVKRRAATHRWQALGLWLLAVALGMVLPAAAQEPPAQGLPTFAELEAAGAVIGEVRVRTADVFDLQDPKESGALYRVANSLHFQTRASVIQGSLLFKRGDRVFYAGSLVRPGANAELHLVDERIVGRKPASLSFAEAAAVPLTAITAWELLFERIGVKRGEAADRRSVLIVGGAGGVGSMAIQIARQLTGLTVVATASRPETQAWVRELGAHHVVDHTQPFAPQLTAVGVPAPDIVLALTGTAQHAGQIAEVIAPEGHLGLIEGAAAFKAFDGGPLFNKSVGVHLELMFTRAMFGTPSMIGQHRLLTEVADLIDRGVLRTTLKEVAGVIDAANLRKAHALVESGKTIGKVVLAGWPGA